MKINFLTFLFCPSAFWCMMIYCFDPSILHKSLVKLYKSWGNLKINDHANSYTWKRLQRPLDMELTLAENDIPDETEEYISLDIDPDEYIPAIHIYFNDDLTEA